MENKAYLAGPLDRDVRGWLPIKTAPYDCDVLLAGILDHPNDWRIKTGHRDGSQYNGWKIYGASWTPQFWMPLPEAPNAEIRGGEAVPLD